MKQPLIYFNHKIRIKSYLVVGMEEHLERMVRMVQMVQTVDAADKVWDTMALWWWLMLLSALFKIDLSGSLANWTLHQTRINEYVPGP